VGYLRRSTDRQEQSIPDQRAAVERYADEHGLALVRCYVDDAISGTSTVGRKAFQQMVEAAESPSRDFSYVVVYDVKRFGRVDNDEAGYYRHLLKQRGVEVLYASEGFNGDGTDDLLRPVKQWQARQESKDLAKVVIRGLVSKAMASARERGKPDAGGSRGSGPPGKEAASWMGGAPPFGYDLRYVSQSGTCLFRLRYERDGSKRMLDDQGALVRTLERGETVAVSKRDHCHLVPGAPDRIETVRKVFRLYVEDRRGYKAIADILNQAGALTARCAEWSGRYGGLWSGGSLRSLLTNPAYVGDLVWNRRTDARFFRITGEGEAVERRGPGARRLRPNDESDWIITENAHEPLITRRVWTLACERLKAQSPTKRVPTEPVDGNPSPLSALDGPRAKFLLSGLCSCSRCGSRYEGHQDPTGTRINGVPREKSYSYACGGYIRRGKSVCPRGAVVQTPFEAAVVQAALEFYKRYSETDGRLALVDAMSRGVGAEREHVQRQRLHLQDRSERLDRTVVNLLDNLTAVNRDLVDRRISDIKREKATLEADLESLNRKAVSKRELRGIIEDAWQFVSTLGSTLSDAPMPLRQAALRRCIDSIVVDRERSTAVVGFRVVPLVLGGPQTDRVEAIEVTLPKPCQRRATRD
jgi:DNA invertase Pin-like site-specific DNA recombinase